MNNDFHCACGRFLGYHHKYKTCFWCRHPAVSTPKPSDSSLAFFADLIGYPENWNVSDYPSIEYALLEIVLTSPCISDFTVNVPAVEDVQTLASECRRLPIPPEEGD